jgi:hypothetical protein
MPRNKLFYNGNLPTIGEISIECSYRGGIAALCGFDEYIESSPPIKYLTRTMSGQEHFLGYNEDTCTTLNGYTFTCNISGSCFYDPVSCILTDNTFINCGGGNSSFCDDLLQFTTDGSGRVASLSSNACQLSSVEVCFFNGSTWGHFDYINYLSQLSNPDTESNAINRLLASSEGIWTTYLDPQSGGCCEAWHESRSTDTFRYKEVRFNIIGSGFTPLHNYRIAVDFYRSVYSFNPSFSYYSSRYYSAVADTSGNILLSDTVPNDIGFSTYASVNQVLNPGSCVTQLSANLLCSQRGGVASLCGFSEQPGYASTPPKKYLNLSGSGLIYNCIFNDGACSSPQNIGSGWILSGSDFYDPNTCELTLSHSLIEIAGVGCPTGTVIGTFNLSDDWGVSPGIVGDLVHFPEIITATSYTQTALSTCYFKDGTHYFSHGSASLFVSGEDTESNAITRLLSLSSWSGYSLCATPVSCCGASYEQRSGFTFNYVEARFQITANNLVPDTVYEVMIDIYRSLYGANNYVLFETIVDTSTTDLSGNFSYLGTIPNTEGYQTYATNPRLF